MRRQYLLVLVLSLVAVLAPSALTQNGAQQPAKGKPADAGGSAALYQKQCAKCHQEDGKGIASLSPPNFTDSSWQSAHTDAQLTKSIQDGKGIMPAFKDVLTPEQITGLVKYVRSFKTKAAAKK